MASSKSNVNTKALFTGGIILVLGVVWLLRKLGVYIPGWVFSWEMILIVIGLALGLENKFRNPASYILILIGSIFLLDDLFMLPRHIMEYFWPLLVIFVGLMVMLRPRFKKNKALNAETSHDFSGDAESISSTSLFNGIKRTIKSQNFKGGETVAVFGGTELNLLNADLDGPTELQCTAIFGGIKLIVPKNWEVRTEATVLFGGIEDKRYSAVEVVTENKILVVTGTVMFGGIDIVSY